MVTRTTNPQSMSYTEITVIKIDRICVKKKMIGFAVKNIFNGVSVKKKRFKITF